jgi:protease-4
VLVLDLRGGLTDQTSPGALASAFSSKAGSVIGIEQTLRAAERDDRVRGLMVRLPEGGIEPAAADELRLAFKRFRAAGKPILAHGQGFYADGTVISTYELAAASGDIWMQPSSSFQATGFAHEDLFFKRFFDLHGVVPDFQQRYEFKNAVNPLLYSDYTAAHRESELGWMGAIYDVVLTDVGADRARPAGEIKRLMEAGPYGAETAMAKGLIDHVGQVKDAEKAILGKAGDGAKLVDFDDYAAQSRRTRAAGAGATIGVISVEGDIMTGKGGARGPFGGDSTIRSDDVENAFQAAIDDGDVKAIVFRVSSPGGSDTASEQILSAVRAAKAAGKPVVVSMGTYAASGGYWISSEASRIVAEPTTLTGSIGVFGGKLALGEALGRFGLDLRGVKVGGDYADSSGARAPMTPSQRAADSAMIDAIYDGFVRRVALGRNLPEARVREIAKGRVWTGAQAKSLGLVDDIGGFYDAVDAARRLGGITGSARLKAFEGEASPLEAVRRFLGGGAVAARLISTLASLGADPAARAVAGQLDDARLRAQGATVLSPRWVR